MQISPRSRLLVGYLTMVLLASSAARAAEPSPAEIYHQQLVSAIDGIQAELPVISASAERAAVLFVNDNFPIAAGGDAPFVTEALERSGGLMSLIVLGDDPTWKGIALYALDESRLEQDLARIAIVRKAGGHVIVFASKREIDHASVTGAEFDAIIDNHGAEHGGILQDDEEHWIIPTDGVSDIVAMWAWTSEFAAACTRLGKMPTFYLGYVNPGGRERAAKIGKVKFHPEIPLPIRAGELGTQYLSELKTNLNGLVADDLADIRATAVLANKARTGGGQCYIFGLGHAINPLIDAELKPGYFKRLSIDPQLSVKLTKNDFVFYIGYALLPPDPMFQALLNELKSSGASAAWSITTYLPREVERLPVSDILIDQHWSAGDADVSVPGYDIKIIPTSGAIAEAVYWMVNAEMVGEKTAKNNE